MLKRMVCGILAILMVLCVCSCGDSTEKPSPSEEASESTHPTVEPTDEEISKEVELSNKNISKYLKVKISYSGDHERVDDGFRFRHYDTATEKIEIYPIQGGNFNNVHLTLILDDMFGWFLEDGYNDCTQLFPNQDNDNIGVTCVEIDLPSDGKYECEYRYNSELAFTSSCEKSSYDWGKDREVYEKYGDFLPSPKQCVSGTFVPAS